MSLHPSKTKFMLITTRQKRQHLSSRCPPILIKNQIVEETDSLDNNLSWINLVTALCTTVSKKVYQLYKIKHFLNFNARKLCFHVHIQSMIDHGSTLWDSASTNTLKPLVSLHMRALKIVLKNTTITSDYKHLFFHSNKYFKGVMMQKILSGKAPPAKFSFSQSRHYVQYNQYTNPQN